MPAATDREIYELIEDVLVEIIDQWSAESGLVWDQFFDNLKGVADEFASVGSILNPSKAVLDLVFGLLDAVDKLVDNLASVPLRVSIEVVAALMPTPDGLGTTVMTTETAARKVLKMTADAAVDLLANPLPLQLRLIERIKGSVGLSKALREATPSSLLGIVKGKVLNIVVRLVAFALKFGATVFTLFLLAQIAVEINQSTSGFLQGVLSQKNPRESITCKGTRINRRVGRD